MERPRFSRLPQLLAAAVLVELCARLCPALGSGTGSALGTAIPCGRLGSATGKRCRTGPERGAGTGQVPTPEPVGQLQTEAEVLPFPGTPTDTAEPPSPQGSPGGLQGDVEGTGEGTGPAVQGTTATEHPETPHSAGTTEQATTSSEWPPPAPLEPEPAPTGGSAPGTPANATAEGALTPQGTPSRSPVPVTLPEGAGVAQGQEGAEGPSAPELWPGEDPGATVPLGASSPGTHPSVAPATGSPELGTLGTSPVVRGLTPTGTPEGLPGRGGAHGSDPRLWHRMAVARQGPHSALHPSLPSLRAGSREDSVASTGQPEAGTGPTSLQGAGSGLPVHTGTAGTPGVTSPGPEGGLDLTTGVLGPPDAEGPTEHSHISLDTTWHPSALPGQVTALVAPGSTAVAQSQVPQASPGSPRVPPSQQAAPASGSIAPTSPSPQPSTGASWGFPGFGPTVGTPWARTTLGQRLPQDDAWGDPAESPQSLEGITAGEGDAGSWAASPPPSWQPGSPAPPAAPGHPRQPPPSGPASSPGPTTALGSSGSAAPGPAPPADAGTVPSEPSAATEPQGDAGVLQRRPPTHGPTVVPGSPRQPTDPSGTVGRRGGPASPPPAGDTDPVQPSSSPGDTPRATPAAAGRAPRVFIVEDQPPLLRAPFLRIPCELVLAMGFVPALRDPASPERRRLLQNFNRTVAPLFMSAPGFLRLEVTGIREGTVVLRYDALFAAERLQLPALRRTLDAALGAPRPGLAVGAAPVLRNAALEGPLDPCARLFSCPPGFACVAGPDGNASCTSLCHRGYCRNQGTCAHPPERGPLCQCPAGSDSWFVGLRCEQRLTRQGLLGTAAGVLLSIVLLGAVIAALAVRRFKVLLLEARADQTRSSYRRFCRLDDVSGQYWSRSWPPSASSLDNPAFSTSEELLHLHALDRGCCGCREGSASADGTKQQPPARPPGRPGCQRGWDTSSSSINDPMVDSGKASDISVSSWPAEPLQWTPFPLLQQLSRQRPHKARRPHSYCEGMELGTLERSWTA